MTRYYEFLEKHKNGKNVRKVLVPLPIFRLIPYIVYNLKPIIHFLSTRSITRVLYLVTVYSTYLYYNYIPRYARYFSYTSYK